ncbi:unnamed protein product [Pedinophyceae sp. YPF-701]|nr:unnamed protein product [Pedinophyceae sp. YPF-701]
MAPGISAWEDVQRERRVWAALPPHPNVVRVFEAIADPDSPKMYIVMELLSGGNILARDASSPSPTLDEDTGRVVRPEGSPGSTLSEADVLRRVQGALKGLSHLHACGIVHGDVNPRNLLLTASGDVKVADLSACLQAFRGSDAVDRTTGAPAFTAPEALRGGSWSGYAADIWSLGVTIYLLLFNCVPFWGASVLDVYSAIERPRSGLPRRGLDAPSDGDAEPAEQERGSREKETADESGAVEQAGWSRELLGLVEAMLEPDPAKRPRCEDLLARAALCAS